MTRSNFQNRIERLQARSVNPLTDGATSQAGARLSTWQFLCREYPTTLGISIACIAMVLLVARLLLSGNVPGIHSPEFVLQLKQLASIGFIVGLLGGSALKLLSGEVSFFEPEDWSAEKSVPIAFFFGLAIAATIAAVFAQYVDTTLPVPVGKTALEDLWL